MSKEKSESEFVMIKNHGATWWGTPSQSFDLAPGVTVLRAAAWQQLLDAKAPINGLPHSAADQLKARLADRTLTVEPVDAEIASSLGKFDRASATALLETVWRPTLLGRWLVAERRAAVRESIARRLCLLLGYAYTIETAGTLAQMAATESDTYLMRMGAHHHLRALTEKAGLREWAPPAPPLKDIFAPMGV